MTRPTGHMLFLSCDSGLLSQGGGDRGRAAGAGTRYMSPLKVGGTCNMFPKVHLSYTKELNYVWLKWVNTQSKYCWYNEHQHIMFYKISI